MTRKKDNINYRVSERRTWREELATERAAEAIVLFRNAAEECGIWCGSLRNMEGIRGWVGQNGWREENGWDYGS